MNRTIAALAAALCLLLAACGQTAPDKDPYDGEDVQALLDSGIFSETPEELDADIACTFFGVDSGLVDSCQAYVPTSTNAEALALFVLSDAKDAQAVETACRSWVEGQIESYQGYGPEHVPKLEGAVISVRANTVLLAVGSDPDAVRAAVDKLP